MAALDIASGSDQKYWVALTAPYNQPTEPPHAAQFSTSSEPARRLQSLSNDGHLLLQLTCRSAAGNLTGSVLEASMEVG